MRLHFDPAKNERSIRLRGLSFERVAEFDFERALFAVDDRRAYPEVRHVAIGAVGGRLHVLCFSETADGIRVISFRKANAREVRRYAQAHPIDPA